MNKIPLVDLAAQYRAHKEELDAAIAECLAETSFVGGAHHKRLTGEFAKWCGGGHAALVGNGTDALELAIHSLLGPGDGEGEIIVPSHTFIATAEAVNACGYRPRFIDIDPDTYLITPAGVEQALSGRTRAVIPVHLYGQMVDMQDLMAVCRPRNIPVIEDAAQAHGARRSGIAPGELSEAACFSFYPGKNLGAWGDGGAVYSKNADLVRNITMRANHGRLDKYLHEFVGRSSRLDGLQAAILLVKLKYIDRWNAARRRAAGWYEEALAGVGGVHLPKLADGVEHVFHLYVIQVPNRDRVLEYLNRNGVGAGVHYPVPLHEQPAYRSLRYKPSDLPITSDVSKRILSLPVYPEITHDQVRQVAEKLKEALAS